MNALDVLTEKILETEWHWLKYHFSIPRDKFIHPLCQSISNACEICEQHMPGFTEEFANRLCSYKNREKYQPHYEQIIQLLAELYVISHVSSLAIENARYEHEPKAEGSDKNPELGVYAESGDMFVEVKCAQFVRHHNERSESAYEIPSRIAGALEMIKSILRPDEKTVLPRDNAVKDFLISANKKFEAFKRVKPESITVLVIIWDDFIYEPISALINPASGLLTDRSFYKEGEVPIKFEFIDAIVVVRHTHHLINSTRDQAPTDGLSHPLDWGYKKGLLPKALFTLTTKDEVVVKVANLFDAIHIDDLQHIAEYRPQDVVMNIIL